MANEKQSLSPAEWKSIGDYLIQLSDKVREASRAAMQTGEPVRESSVQASSKEK